MENSKNKKLKLITTIKKYLQNIKENPKKALITFINWFREIVKHNTLFFVFLSTSLFNSILLRYFTINTFENLVSLKPILADLTIISFVGAFSFLVKKRNQFTYLLTSSIILTAICIINSSYYTFYTSFSSISLLATSKYIVAVGDAVVENVLKIRDLIYLISPIALIYTYIKLLKQKKFETKPIRDKRKFKKVLKFSLTCLIMFAVNLNLVEIGRFYNLWNREYIVMKFGIYTYHINDLIHSIGPKITTLFGYDEALKTFNEYYKNKEDKQTWENEYTNIFEGKNIISIHAESMQNFLIGLEFNGQEVIPNLNKIAKSSLYFSNFYAQVSVGTSSDSEFTLSTSLMPTNNGTAFVSYFDREYVTIPKLLKEKGYFTFSMHANNRNYWNRDIMHKSLGYDKFYAKDNYEIDEVIGLGLSDKSFFKQSIEYIKEINKEGKPYYGTVIMLTNHTPFSELDKYGEFDVDIKEEIINKKGEKEIVSYPYMEGTKLGNYIKSAHYADQALGEFIDALEQNGLMENTVLMIYGDHDNRLPQSEYMRLFNYDKKTDDILEEDDPNYFEIDTYQYDMLRKVPFMLYSKETKENLHKEITNVMGMYDVMPTLGNMFGFYNKYQLGHDIFEIGNDNIVVFPNGNWITDKVFYNARKDAYLPLQNVEITDKYIKENDNYANKLLNVSNSLIVFDLIEKEQEKINANEDYIEERIMSK